jgi:hypothetical protein
LRQAKVLVVVVALMVAQAGAMRPATAVATLGSCDPSGTLRQMRWDTGTLSRVWLQSCVRTPPGKATAVGIWSLTDRDNGDVDEVDVLTTLLRKDGSVLRGWPCYYYGGFPEQPDDTACNGPDYFPPTGTVWQCYAHIRVRVFWNNGRLPSTTEFLDSKLVSCPGN